MGKRDIENLKHKNPDVRKKAIRAVAKAKDPNALNLLVSMAKKDPEKELRKLAEQAAIYIQKNAKPVKDDGKVEVSDKDKKRAQNLLSSAQGFLMSGDNDKVAKAMKKALQIDPNLRTDGYFVSLAEEVTGEEGQTAVNLLADKGLISQLSRETADAHKSEEQQQHLEEVSKTPWGAALFDFALIWVLGLIGSFLILFLMIYQSGSYFDKLKQNRNDYNAAIRAGNLMYDNEQTLTDVDADVQTFWRNGDRDDPESWYAFTQFFGHPASLSSGKVTSFCPNGCTPAASGGSAKTVGIMVPSGDLFSIVQEWREKPVSDLILPSLGFATILPLMMLITSAIVHVFAAFIFRALGRLPHTIDKVTMTFLTRLVLLIVGLIVAIFFGFMFDQLILLIQLVAAGVAVITLFNLILAVGKAYKMAFPLALIVTIIGLIPMAASIGFVLIQADILTI